MGQRGTLVTQDSLGLKETSAFKVNQDYEAQRETRSTFPSLRISKEQPDHRDQTEKTV